jgi:hypothetical protein
MPWSKDGEIHTHGGFIYIVVKDEMNNIKLTPAEGQPRSAKNKKNMDAALRAYEEEESHGFPCDEC